MPNDESAAIAIEFNNLSIKNDGVRTRREWALENVTFRARASQRTLVFGLPGSGKSTLMHAILHPEAYPDLVMVNVDIQELSPMDSHDWTAKQYADKYEPELRPEAFVVVNDAYEEAMPYLAQIDRGMLVLAGVDGHECFHRFDRLLYLHDGCIHFDGTPREFFGWVGRTRPVELEYTLAPYLVASGGETPGCPELDE